MRYLQMIAPYEVLWLGLMLVSIMAFIIEFGIAFVRYIKKKRKMKAINRQDLESIMGEDYTGRSLLDRDDAMQKIVAPDGVDPNADPSYLIINDGGINVYERTFTLTTISKNTEFASTFSPLLNFCSATSSIFLTPISSGTMQHLVDRHISTLETEYNRSDDVNRTRRLRNQLQEEQVLAANLEQGNSTYYKVSLVITIRSNSLDGLSSQTDALLAAARSRSGLNLAGCFAVQPEAFKTNAPVNKLYKKEWPFLSKSLPLKIKSDSVESFLMDQKSASTFFNYQQNNFDQKQGAFLGWNMPQKSIARWDPFLSKNGYNTIFAGMTRSGKSVAAKVMIGRMAHNTRFVAVDSQRPAGMDEGEYCPIARQLNGTIYRISNDADSDKMNIFEVSTTTRAILDEHGQLVAEEEIFPLDDAKVSIAANIMLIITSNSATRGANKDLDVAININDKVTEIITQCFDERGIKNGKPETLYKSGYEQYAFIDRPKKNLPTLTRFFEIAAYKRAKVEDEDDRKTYKLIMSAIKEYVTFCAYNIVTGEVYAEKDYESMNTNPDGSRYIMTASQEKQNVLCAKGSRLYYDGQSTISKKTSRFTNIDISGLPETEVPLARSIGVHLVNQQFIQTNSENPEKEERLVAIYDEGHYMLDDPYASQVLSAQARTCAKRYVSMWLFLQQLTDAQNNKHAAVILENSAYLFLFKHRDSSKKYVQEVTGMTDAQFSHLCDLGGDPDSMNSINRKGETCLVAGKHCYFLKVAYIKETEAYLAETDAQERARLYKERQKQATTAI